MTRCWLLLLALLGACERVDEADAPWSPRELALLRSLTPPPAQAPPSPGNRVADEPRAIALGHKLFFDKGLSANGQVACATCHQPERWFTDGLPRAKGLDVTARNAPTVLGAQFLPFVYQDGRKDSLWSQALGPLESPGEHGLDRVAVVRHVATCCRADYEALFGALPDLDRLPVHARPVPLGSTDPLDVAWRAVPEADRAAVDRAFAQIGKVIEAYERRLLPKPAPFDRYAAAVLANDPKANTLLTADARRGLRAFLGKAQCVSCHNGPLFTDKQFHNLGLPTSQQASGVDVGRSLGAQQVKEDPFRCGGSFSDARQCDELRFLDPQFPDFMGAFKTPTLRNVARTAPYMHDGQFATLAQVVQFYKTLPGKPIVGHRELVLHLLDSAVDTNDLVAFLATLTGPLPEDKWLHAP
jgi:cytochrome c peroxidase